MAMNLASSVPNFLTPEFIRFCASTSACVRSTILPVGRLALNNETRTFLKSPLVSPLISSSKFLLYTLNIKKKNWLN